MEFALAVLLLVIGLLVILGARALSSKVRVCRTPLVRQPFQSGIAVSEHAASRFHVRWYTIAVVFLAFDMEMVFMYPWVLVVRQTGAGSVVEMFAFLAVLVVGVIYAWREGVFRWS
jgi:NADH-quinone oxidoreductase subunit A